VGIESELTLKTDDGWQLHGRLRIPDGLAAGKKVAAIAFSHGANHDMDTFQDFTKTLAKAGIASIIYDRRGRNPDPKLARPPAPAGGGLGDDSLDLKAAIDYLVAQKEIDAERIGVVGATAGNQPVFKLTVTDIKTVLALTLENMSDIVRKAVSTRDIPFFFIASTEDLNTGRQPPDHPFLADNSKDAYALTKNRWSQFLLYDDAGRGSEMVKVKPEIEGMMVRWFLDKLAPASAASMR
jgi:poly(3-hydroxybutyrate) depolymerase